MKREQKSLTNKGFSLVELIIVVAIMAVLIGVLAPQYLRYVEKTRLQRDNTSISDFANVLKIAATDEAINAELATASAPAGTGAGIVYVFDSTSHAIKQDPANGPLLDAEVALTVTLADVKLTSNTYLNATDTPTLTIKADANGIVSVTAEHWMEKPDSAAGGVQKKF